MQTFEVHVDTILSAPWLTLPNNDSRHDLLPKIGLTLLDGGHNHVTDTSRRQPVEATFDALDGDNVEVLRTGVVSAVHGRRYRKP